MSKELMLIGAKESFLIRTLEKKLSERGIANFYCAPDIDRMNAVKDRVLFAVYYLNDDEHIPHNILHYLSERYAEDNIKLILIGDKTDTEPIKKSVESAMLLESYQRPLDTDKFLKDIAKHMKWEKDAVLRKKIMIVDDDLTYMSVVRGWLRDNYQVYMANSGLQAIKTLGVNQVDLILLDYQMPVTSGPQVLEMIRSESETASIPVFFLTGRNDKESVMQVIGLKPEGYLLKSIGKEELLKTLNEFFSKQQGEE